jgi:hypothetical protein
MKNGSPLVSKRVAPVPKGPLRFASHLVMAGVDVRTVQEVGGWRTMPMVQRYSHLAPAPRRGSRATSASDAPHRSTANRRATYAELRLRRVDAANSTACCIVNSCQSSHGGLALTGKAADLKSAGPQGPWGFESLALRQLTRSPPLYPSGAFHSRYRGLNSDQREDAGRAESWARDLTERDPRLEAILRSTKVALARRRRASLR